MSVLDSDSPRQNVITVVHSVPTAHPSAFREERPPGFRDRLASRVHLRLAARYLPGTGGGRAARPASWGTPARGQGRQPPGTSVLDGRSGPAARPVTGSGVWKGWDILARVEKASELQVVN